ncbi:hypothetical protein ABIA33_003895 [Streptacidiphilus sp. MAP12-16]
MTVLCGDCAPASSVPDAKCGLLVVALDVPKPVQRNHGDGD